MAKRKRSHNKKVIDSAFARETLFTLVSMTRGSSFPETDDPISLLAALRGFAIEATRDGRTLPMSTCLSMLDAFIENAGGEAHDLTEAERTKIARLAVYCSGCREFDGARCQGYPDRDWRYLLSRRFFCLRYVGAEGRGEVLEKNFPDVRIGFWGKLLLLAPILVLLVFIPIWAVLRRVLKVFWFAVVGILWVIFRGARLIWRGVDSAAHYVGRKVGRVTSFLRDTSRRWARVIDAARGAMTGPFQSERPEDEPVSNPNADTDALFRELAEVRLEAEGLRADLAQRPSGETSDDEAHRARLSVRVTELEDHLTETQEKLRAVQDRSRILGRLVRQQQAILGGKIRSARRLAVGKRRLGQQLREAASLLPDDTVVDAEEADVIEGLLDVAEAELEERDAEAATLRADLDDALVELEVYEHQLATAEKRAQELAASRIEAAPNELADKSLAKLPSRFGNTTITTTRRFDKELEGLPTYLRAFVAVGLQRLLDNPELMARRTYVVDEADRTAYHLPRVEGLRKCRLNVKYRMFILPQESAVELVSVAKHA